ncbi:MAG: primosomal protein N', partial [Candidatus Zixiibacteriota bacterium]
QVTALHSAMTERERLDSWQGIRSGKYRIVVGPRSALFAPMKNPGLIIVDEEHDGSYKQDDPAPRFHGRDAAIMRAKISRIPILLGSASPSVESYHHARTGRYRLLTLTDRPGAAKLPAVEIVDMRSQKIGGEHTFLSYPLKKHLQRCLSDGDQAILFLNRRGYSPQLKCGDCGHHPICPSCKVALTYHKVGQKLSCHYCGHLRLDYHQCEKCKGIKPVFLGAGTQKIEDQIPLLVDQARTIRFDSDTASGRRRAHRILRAFADRKYNLLLGTQMVTKGLDMKGVSLVGVLSADHGLDMPDFRASEKTFAQLLQVAGRSGRSDRTGHVTIQTYRPDDPVIADAACQDYTAFFDREILSRKEVRFPPFRRLANLTLSGADDRKVLRASEKLRDLLRNACTGSNLEVQIMGPAPCPLHYLRNKYRYHLLVKIIHMVGFARLLAKLEAHQPGFGLPSTVKIEVDIDPVDMM